MLTVKENLYSCEQVFSLSKLVHSAHALFFPWKAVTSSTKAPLPGPVGFVVHLHSPLGSPLSTGTGPEGLLSQALAFIRDFLQAVFWPQSLG